MDGFLYASRGEFLMVGARTCRYKKNEARSDYEWTGGR
jgi:hypothetical protein